MTQNNRLVCKYAQLPTPLRSLQSTTTVQEEEGSDKVHTYECKEHTTAFQFMPIDHDSRG